MIVALATPATAGAAPARAPGSDPLDQRQLAGLEWRNIGPYRGGRVTAVTGVVGQRNVYYFGGTGSGIWKSKDSGLSWQNISDGQLATGSVGMSLTGAMTPAGLGMSAIIPLLEAGFVDWIISTGANLYHDAHFGLGLAMHQGTPFVDDVELRDKGVVRIYDIFFDYSVLLDTDAFFREVIGGPLAALAGCMTPSGSAGVISRSSESRYFAITCESSSTSKITVLPSLTTGTP